jgi:hypothetical protein
MYAIYFNVASFDHFCHLKAITTKVIKVLYTRYQMVLTTEISILQLNQYIIRSKHFAAIMYKNKKHKKQKKNTHTYTLFKSSCELPNISVQLT